MLPFIFCGRSKSLTTEKLFPIPRALQAVWRNGAQKKRPLLLLQQTNQSFTKREEKHIVFSFTFSEICGEPTKDSTHLYFSNDLRRK
jgi:hypothetical protein